MSDYTPSLAGADDFHAVEGPEAEEDEEFLLPDIVFMDLCVESVPMRTPHPPVEPDEAPPLPAPEAPPEELPATGAPRPLAELADGDPTAERRLGEEASSTDHLMTHYPKNPYCRLCNIAKNTAMRVARQRDGRADDLIDPPKNPFEQLATDDVILAKGDDHTGIGIGG